MGTTCSNCNCNRDESNELSIDGQLSGGNGGASASGQGAANTIVHQKAEKVMAYALNNFGKENVC